MAAARHEAEVGKQGGVLRGPDGEQRGTGTDHREVGTAWPRKVHAHRRGRAIQAWHVCKSGGAGKERQFEAGDVHHGRDAAGRTLHGQERGHGREVPYVARLGRRGGAIPGVLPGENGADSIVQGGQDSEKDPEDQISTGARTTRAKE